MKTKTVKELRADTIAFAKWDPDARSYVRVVRKGRLFSLAGAPLVLFPSSVLAEAIDREVRTLRMWERAKMFPATQWKTPDKRCKHWYTGSQIRFIHDLHRQFCGKCGGTSDSALHGFSHSRQFPLQEFLDAVKKGFYLQDSTRVLGGTDGQS